MALAYKNDLTQTLNQKHEEIEKLKSQLEICLNEFDNIKSSLYRIEEDVTIKVPSSSSS